MKKSVGLAKEQWQSASDAGAVASAIDDALVQPALGGREPAAHAKEPQEGEEDAQRLLRRAHDAPLSDSQDAAAHARAALVDHRPVAFGRRHARAHLRSHRRSYTGFTPCLSCMRDSMNMAPSFSMHEHPQMHAKQE